VNGLEDRDRRKRLLIGAGCQPNVSSGFSLEPHGGGEDEGEEDGGSQKPKKSNPEADLENSKLERNGNEPCDCLPIYTHAASIRGKSLPVHRTSKPVKIRTS
jgi:hypothetical protein